MPSSMAWLLARTCFPKKVPRSKFSSFQTRAWSKGAVTAYMPEATAFPGSKDHQALYQVSVEQADAFWGALGRSRLTWINPFHTVSYSDLQKGHMSWFLGGQLNVAGYLKLGQSNPNLVLHSCAGPVQSQTCRKECPRCAGARVQCRLKNSDMDRRVDQLDICNIVGLHHHPYCVFDF